MAKKMTKSAAARAAASANESFMAGSKPNAHAKISSIVAKHAAAGAAAASVKRKAARAPIDPEVRTSMLTARQTGKIPGQPDITHDVTTKHLRAIEADRKKELSKASTGAVPKKGMATHVTEHVSSKAKAKIAGLAASVGDKHKKIQAKVNKHLGKRTAALAVADMQSGNTLASGKRLSRAGASAGHHDAMVHRLKKQLPQGYAMVFGKLRKITAGKPRTGIAKLKR